MPRNTKGQFDNRPRFDKRKRVSRKCPVCEKEFEVVQWRLKNTPIITCSRGCANVIRFKGTIKEKWGNEFRKNNRNKYTNIHKKIYKLYGKANKCEYCLVIGRKYYWANKTGDYLLERNDWLELCASCHWKYDYIKAHA